jgi:hypothetical protein
MGEFDLFEVFGNLFAAHANMSDVRVYARPGRDPESISLRRELVRRFRREWP